MPEGQKNNAPPFGSNAERLMAIAKAVTAVVAAIGALVAAIAQLTDLLPDIPPWVPIPAAVALLLIAWACWPRRRSRLLDPDALRLDPDNPEHLVGRADDIERLVTVVRENKLTFLVGESGAGKSALVRSGLRPELAKSGQLLPIYLDTWGNDWEAGPRRALCDAVFQSLLDDEKEKLGLETRPKPESVIEIIRRLDAELGRTPLVIFDQFDDYQARHRKQFITGKNRTFRKTKSLLKANPFWSDMQTLLDEQKIHCLFVTRADTAAGLRSVELADEEVTETVPLVRPKTTIVDTLLADLTKPTKDHSPVVAHPDHGWDRLMPRLARDLDKDRFVLPIQMKLVFQSLADLPGKVLTVRNYDKAGGRAGLEALHIRAQISAAAKNPLGPTMTDSQIRAMLLALVDDDAATPKTTAMSAPQLHQAIAAGDCSADAVENTVQFLTKRKLLRKRIDTDTGIVVYQLDHDYLGAAVLEADRRANRWQTMLREAQHTFRDAGNHLWRRYKLLLTPWQQLRLLIERIRGRLRYEEARSLAAASLCRFAPYVFVATAAFVGWRVYQEQQEEERIAARQQAEYDIAERIGRKIHGQGSYPDTAEFAALNELANWEPPTGDIATGDGVRLSFIRQIVAEQEKAKAFRNRLPWVLQAVVGLDRAMREQVKELLLEQGVPNGDEPDRNAAIAILVQSLDIDAANLNSQVAANYLAAMEKTSNANTLAALGIALGSLGTNLSAAHAAAGVEQILATMERTDDPPTLDSLGRALASLATKLQQEQAVDGAKRIVSAMEKTTDYRLLASLGTMLGGLGAKLPANRAAAGANMLIAALGTKTDGIARFGLRDALVNLGMNLSAEKLEPIADEIMATMKSTTNNLTLDDLAVGLGTLGANLSQQQAAAAAEIIMAAMGRPASGPGPYNLDYALITLASNLSNAQAEGVADVMLAAMQKTTFPMGCYHPGRILVSLDTGLPPMHAWAAFQRIVTVMQGTDDPAVAVDLGWLLAALCKRLTADQTTLAAQQVSPAAQQIISAMLVREASESHHPDSLQNSLAGLAQHLFLTEQARDIAQHIVDVMQGSTDPPQLSILSYALSSLGAKLPKQQAEQAAQHIVAVMQETTDPDAIAALGLALGSLGDQLPTEEATAAAERIAKAMEDASNDSVWFDLVRALAKLGKDVPVTRVGRQFQQLVSNIGSGRYPLFWEPVLSTVRELVPTMTTKQAESLAKDVTVAMTREQNADDLNDLGNSLLLLGKQLQAEESLTLFKEIVAAMGKTTDGAALLKLRDPLQMLGAKLLPMQAETVAEQIVVSMERTADDRVLSSLAHALGSLGANLSAEKAAAGASHIVAAVQRAADSHELTLLTRALGRLAPRLAPESVASLLKSVTCVGDLRRELLEQLWWHQLDGNTWTLLKEGSEARLTFWGAVDWAEAEGIDVDAVPGWPLPSRD